MSLKTIKALFLLAAVYDLILGFVFGVFYRPIYQAFAVALPNHAGYVQLSGAFIFVFGIAFVWVWRDPIKNLPIITLGILMKVAFCVVAFGHLLVNWLPVFYIPFAILDLIFLVLFWMAQTAVKKLAVTG